MKIRSNEVYGREWICGTANNMSEIPDLLWGIYNRIKDRKATEIYHQRRTTEGMLRVYPNPSEGPDLITVDNEPGKKDQIWITVLMEGCG